MNSLQNLTETIFVIETLTTELFQYCQIMAQISLLDLLVI